MKPIVSAYLTQYKQQIKINLRISRFVFHYSLFPAAMNNHFICHDKNLLKAEKVSFFKNILIPFKELNFIAVNVYLR